VYVALPKPMASPDSARRAAVKSTLTLPAEISVPVAPVPESVGRVPPSGANVTVPDVGSDVASVP